LVLNLLDILRDLDTYEPEWFPSQPSDWVKLLKEIYYEPICDGLPPINKNLTEKDLKDISKVIIDTVGPEPAITFYSNYLILHLNNQQVKKALQDALIPGESKIVESDKQSLRMFGLDQKPFGLWTWQDLTRELENVDELI
jgi:hypothetical protein